MIRTHSALGVLLLAAALAAGCKKHRGASIGDAATNTARSPGAPVAMAYTPTTIVTPTGSDITATLSQLSLELRKYVVTTRSVPGNFEEFVAKSHLQVPPAPPGKKYAIQNQAIVLIKR